MLGHDAGAGSGVYGVGDIPMGCGWNVHSGGLVG